MSLTVPMDPRVRAVGAPSRGVDDELVDGLKTFKDHMDNDLGCRQALLYGGGHETLAQTVSTLRKRVDRAFADAILDVRMGR